MPDAYWKDVKQLLDDLMKRWAEEHGREAKLKVVHEGNLGWSSKEELAQSAPYDLQLIEPDKVGNGKAHETNLIKILRRNIGGYRRMPSRGPYLSDEEIEIIAKWIDDGMPD